MLANPCASDLQYRKQGEVLIQADEKSDRVPGGLWAVRKQGWL
jgi:hypothetical protein